MHAPANSPPFPRIFRQDLGGFLFAKSQPRCPSNIVDSISTHNITTKPAISIHMVAHQVG